MELSELRTKIIESFTMTTEALEEVLQLVEDDRSIFPINDLFIIKGKFFS